MKILFYSTKTFEQKWLSEANKNNYELTFISDPLSIDTVYLAKGYKCVSVFTADDVSEVVIKKLSELGVQFITIRATGFDNVDINAANANGMRVANVPDYSPYAVAEHAVTLLLALNRKIIKANAQVHQQNFLLDDLVGFDLHGKTVGIIGTGRIGSVFARIMHGFGCTLLACDLVPSTDLIQNYGVHYVDLSSLCRFSDIISIHTPLTNETRNLIDELLLKRMKHGVLLINTARGAVVNTTDVLKYLENGHIGGYGMDVYEKEKGIFFFDDRNDVLNDEQLKKLLSLPNVLLTPHQAFATKEALNNIATTTFLNIDRWQRNEALPNELTLHRNETTVLQ